MGECVVEERERTVEGEELVIRRGEGELWVVAGLEAEVASERMDGCGRGGIGDGWEGEE